MWGSTPPKAMVARIRVSNSSSPRMASCRCRGVMRLTLRSLAAFPASSSTSAVRYSSTAVTYTAAKEHGESAIKGHEGGAKKSHTFCAHTHLVLSVVLEETLDSTAGELDEIQSAWVFITKRRQKGKIQALNNSKRRMTGDGGGRLKQARKWMIEVSRCKEHWRRIHKTRNARMRWCKWVAIVPVGQLLHCEISEALRTSPSRQWLYHQCFCLYLQPWCTRGMTIDGFEKDEWRTRRWCGGKGWMKE